MAGGVKMVCIEWGVLIFSDFREFLAELQWMLSFLYKLYWTNISFHFCTQMHFLEKGVF